MRVSLPIAIALLLAVLLGVWFTCTRKMDFLTPPTAEKLEISRQIALHTPRSKVQLPTSPAQSQPVVNRPPQRIQTRPPPPSEAAERNPSLDTFANLAPKGSRHLIELSSLVEASGDRRRTLLVWERVIDSTKPLATHLDAAFAAVKRLRAVVPLWSAGNRPIPVVIHVSASDKLEANLKPVLDRLVKDLAEASHGVLAPTAQLAVSVRPPAPKSSSRRSSRSPSTPVALRLSGPGDDSRSTPTLSFAVTKTDKLHADLLGNLFKLVADQLAADKSHIPVSTPPKGEPPMESLSFRITRLRWLELGQSLSLPKSPPTP